MRGYISKILIFISLLALSAGATGAPTVEKFTPMPPRLDGSMMPIDFDSFTRSPWLPDSLVPVYGAYVARHGARYLSSYHKLMPVVEQLQKARNTHTLSESGDRFFSLIDHIIKVNEGHWGDLSDIGYMEERELGKRIFNILTPLQEKGSRVHAISSYMSRCVMTMYLFTNTLVSCNDNITVATDEGHQFDSLMCCFMADSTFARYRKSGEWKDVYDKFLNGNVSPEPARRLFKTTDLSDHQLRQLTFDIYEVLKANRAYGLPAPTTRWMTEEEYYNCWRASNLQHYLRNSITKISDIAGQASLPLLNELISKIDRAVNENSPQPSMNAYFGHAETLLPLVALMRLPGCYTLTEDYEELERSWKIENIAPLGANLLILVSRSPSGRHYVSLMLNGRSVRPIPGRPDFVNWNELKQFWLQTLSNPS